MPRAGQRSVPSPTARSHRRRNRPPSDLDVTSGGTRCLRRPPTPFTPRAPWPARAARAMPVPSPTWCRTGRQPLGAGNDSRADGISVTHKAGVDDSFFACEVRRIRPTGRRRVLMLGNSLRPQPFDQFIHRHCSTVVSRRLRRAARQPGPAGTRGLEPVRIRRARRRDLGQTQHVRRCRHPGPGRSSSLSGFNIDKACQVAQMAGVRQFIDAIETDRRIVTQPDVPCFTARHPANSSRRPSTA